MKAQKLPAYEVDVDARRLFTSHLTAQEYGAYARLIDHYWLWGTLPLQPRRLAAVCGVHVRSFERMSASLLDFFDVDEAGLWRDAELEERRDKVMQGKARRSQAASAAAVARWKTGAAAEAAHEHEHEGSSAERPADVPPIEPNATPDAMRSALPNALRPAVPNGAETRLGALPSAMRPLAPVFDEEDDDKEKSSSSSSSLPAASACDAHADRNADGAADHVNSQAPNHAPAMRPMNAVGNADRSGANAPVQAIGDDALLAAVLEATGGNVEEHLHHSSELGPIRQLMAEGCDLDRDIRPALKAVRKLKARLGTYSAPFIREKALLRRDSPSVPPQRLTNAVRPPTIFVRAGTDAWQAWNVHGNATGEKPGGYKAIPNARTGEKGNWFASALPPALTTAVAAE